jgi:Flp pilus assembly protein TadG
MTRRDRDRGNAIVEFAIWVPIVLIALCTCLQLMSLLYAQRAANTAATSAALAQRAGSDPLVAARAALPEGADEAIVTVTNGSVRVDMPARRYLILLPKRFAEVSGTASTELDEP